MNNKQATVLMTEGNILKIIITFAIPIFISTLFQQLYNAVDSAIVGAVEGPTSIAAVGTTGPIINLLVGLFLGLAAGCSATVARHFASKNNDKLSDAVHTGMALSVIAGLFMMIVGIAFAEVLLKVIKCPKDTIDLSVKYLRIYFIGMIPMLMYNIGAGILQGVGDSKRPLYFLIISGFCNVILDFVFVYFFSMGVGGAALATVISQVISATLVLIKLMNTNEVYKFIVKKIRIVKNELKAILKLGIPAGLQSVCFAISNFIIQGYINVFGSSVMAGITAYSKIDSFLYMPTSALGITTMTFVSQNLAVQDTKRAKKGTNLALLISLLVTLVLVLIVMCISKPLVGMFTQQDPIAIKYGIRMMWFLAPFTIVYAFIEVYSGFVKAAGATIQSMVITATTICVSRIVWLLVMSPIYDHKNIDIVFLCYPISWVLCCITYTIYYMSNRWKKYTKQHRHLELD